MYFYQIAHFVLKSLNKILQQKNRLYIVKKEVFSIDENKLRIDSIGLYFGTMTGNDLRLSIEGSQIVGPEAKQNIIEINVDQRKLWLSGEDIDLSRQKKNDLTGFLLVRCRDDFLGCGRFRDNTLMNYYPKSRRINSVK